MTAVREASTAAVGSGTWGGLASPGLTVPGLPASDGTHVLDVLLAAWPAVAELEGRRAAARA